MSRRQDLYRVLNVPSQTVAIDKTEIWNTISIDRTTPTQNTLRPQDAAYGVKTIPPKDVTPLGNPSTEQVDHITGYVVDHIVSYGQSPDGRRQRVRWCGDTSKDNYFKPLKHLQSHFVKIYWKSCRAHTKSQMTRPL